MGLNLLVEQLEGCAISSSAVNNHLVMNFVLTSTQYDARLLGILTTCF